MILHDVYADFVEQEMALPVIRGSRPKRRSSPVRCAHTRSKRCRMVVPSRPPRTTWVKTAKAFNITFSDQTTQSSMPGQVGASARV